MSTNDNDDDDDVEAVQTLKSEYVVSSVVSISGSFGLSSLEEVVAVAFVERRLVLLRLPWDYLQMKLLLKLILD